jgi:hypothetical protein
MIGLVGKVGAQQRGAIRVEERHCRLRSSASA